MLAFEQPSSTHGPDVLNYSPAATNMTARVLPEVLFKYLSTDRINVIEDASIRFSQFPALNDPCEGFVCFDTEAYLSGGHMERLVAEALEGKPRTPEEEDWIRKFYATDGPVVASIIKRTMRKFERIVNEEVGILSLSKTCLSAPMWAHYGTCGRGFCLGLDSNQSPISCGREVVSMSVEYREVPPVVNPRGMAREAVLVAFLGTKSRDWKYEQEVRVIRAIKDCHYIGDSGEARDKIYVSSFPPQALKQVIFGARASSLTKDDVRRACKAIGAQPMFLQAVIKPGSYDLGIMPAE